MANAGSTELTLEGGVLTLVATFQPTSRTMEYLLRFPDGSERVIPREDAALLVHFRKR